MSGFTDLTQRGDPLDRAAALADEVVTLKNQLQNGIEAMDQWIDFADDAKRACDHDRVIAAQKLKDMNESMEEADLEWSARIKEADARSAKAEAANKALKERVAGLAEDAKTAEDAEAAALSQVENAMARADRAAAAADGLARTAKAANRTYQESLQEVPGMSEDEEAFLRGFA